MSADQLSPQSDGKPIDKPTHKFIPMPRLPRHVNQPHLSLQGLLSPRVHVPGRPRLRAQDGAVADDAELLTPYHTCHAHQSILIQLCLELSTQWIISADRAFPYVGSHTVFSPKAALQVVFNAPYVSLQLDLHPEPSHGMYGWRVTQVITIVLPLQQQQQLASHPSQPHATWQSLFGSPWPSANPAALCSHVLLSTHLVDACASSCASAGHGDSADGRGSSAGLDHHSPAAGDDSAACRTGSAYSNGDSTDSSAESDGVAALSAGGSAGLPDASSDSAGLTGRCRSHHASSQTGACAPHEVDPGLADCICPVSNLADTAYRLYDLKEATDATGEPHWHWHTPPVQALPSVQLRQYTSGSAGLQASCLAPVFSIHLACMTHQRCNGGSTVCFCQVGQSCECALLVMTLCYG